MFHPRLDFFVGVEGALPLACIVIGPSMKQHFFMGLVGGAIA